MKYFYSTLCLIALIQSVLGCGFPGSPSHAVVSFTPEVIRPGTVATYECEPGFELLGPSRRICSSNATWTPAGIPFCVLNVAAGKAPMQSSVALGGVPERAVDGSTSNFFTPETCTMTESERAPWWYVNLLEPYMVQLVRLDFGKACCGNGKPATIVVRVGNNRPDLGVNAICNRFTGFIEEGRPLFLPCNPPMPGAFVSVHLEGSPGNPLSICEAFVYTDQALPIERCPQFRDQEPGSTATYNGKCYMFHNTHPLNFNEARQFCEARGGSLIDETNPALQGFISWELWRRHARNDPNGQYWMGARRDPQDRTNWRWLSGREVSVSFWNLPSGNENCARYDGTKGWLWADTNCNRRLHFICQHRPKSCGRPEQPANGTLLAENFNVGNRIEYRCDPGHMAIGPTVRTCLPSGFFSEYPPVCKYVQCGFPARIPNGVYKLVNDSRHYLSMVSYSCNEGHQLIGRGDLICDVDGRWNGPPPRCEPVYCLEPPQIANGGFRLSTNSTVAGTVVDYYCLSLRYKLSGPNRIFCKADGHYDKDPPVCIENTVPDTNNLDRTDTDVADETVYDDDYYEDVARPPIRKVAAPSAPPAPSAPSAPSGPPAPSTPSTPTTTTVRTTTSTTKPPVRSTTVPSTTGRPRISTPRTTTPPRRSPVRGPSANGPAGARPKDTPQRKSDESVTDSAGPVYLSPQDNEIADSANVRNNVPPNVNEPTNTENAAGSEGTFGGRLNLGGIIALGVFGGFVFLAAIITTVVIVIRRIRNDKRYRRRGTHTGSATAAAFETTGVDDRGLNKFYRQAWDNLEPSGKRSKSHHHHHGEGHGHGHHGRKDTIEDPNYRSRLSSSEVVRDEGEMVVSSSKHADKKRHHHHHHHKHNKRSAGGEW